MKQTINDLASNAEQFRGAVATLLGALDNLRNALDASDPTKAEAPTTSTTDEDADADAEAEPEPEAETLSAVQELARDILADIDENIVGHLHAKQTALAAIDEAITARQKAKREYDYYFDKVCTALITGDMFTPIIIISSIHVIFLLITAVMLR